MHPTRSCGRGSCTTFHDLRPPYLFPKAGPLRDYVTHRLARASDAVIGTNGSDVANSGNGIAMRPLDPDRQ